MTFERLTEMFAHSPTFSAPHMQNQAFPTWTIFAISNSLLTSNLLGKWFSLLGHATICLKNSISLETLHWQWSWISCARCSHILNASHVWLFITQSQGNGIPTLRQLLWLLHFNSYHRLIKNTKSIKFSLNFQKGEEGMQNVLNTY